MSGRTDFRRILELMFTNSLISGPHMPALIKDKGPKNHLVLLVSYPCYLQADVLSDQTAHNTDSFQSS